MRVEAVRLAVAASGEGTTFAYVARAAAEGRIPVELVLLLASRAEAGAVRRARDLEIPTEILNPADFESDDGWDLAVANALRAHGADVLLLAGYLRKLGPRSLRTMSGRIFNTHPALLPKYGGKGMYGAAVYEAVLASGDSESGVTIHLVDQHYDAGPIVLQRRTTVEPGDTVASLKERVQQVEREAIVDVLSMIASRTAPQSADGPANE